MSQQSPFNNVTHTRSRQMSLSEVPWQKAAFWKVWTNKVSAEGLTSKEHQTDLSSLCFCAMKISLHLMHISSNTNTTRSTSLLPAYVVKVTLWVEWEHHLYAYAHQTNEFEFSPVGQSVSLSRKQMKMGTERRIYSVTLTKTKNLRCIIRLQSRLRAGTCQLAN